MILSSDNMQKKTKLSDHVIPKFNDFWKATKKDKYLYYVLKGGRSSAKSSHIALNRIVATIKNPVNGLAIRKHAKYMRESIFTEFKWAARLLDVDHYFKFQVSPMQIIYKPRGNKILFAGADDPTRIKSLSTEEFPYTWLWVEELAEFKTKDDVSTIEDSIVREETGFDYKVFYSYNPPKRKTNWCNKKFNSVTLPDIYFVHHTDYKDNPFIAKQTLQKINILKEENERKYRHTWLGKPIGSGVVPFENLKFRKITDEEIKRFDNHKQGIDWGYGADPTTFVRWHYDSKRKKIYAIDEKYQIKLKIEDLADWMINKKYHDHMSIADSAEPRSIAQLKDYGVKVKGAEKGPGSVEHGEKWLDELNAIVIDPKRTPNIAREFENIDYQVDRDGNIKNKLIDKDNHTIDPTRYAHEKDMIVKDGWGF